MCNPSLAAAPVLSALALSALIKKELDVDVEPAKLLDFIGKNWEQIAPFAHIIHNAYAEKAKETTND